MESALIYIFVTAFVYLTAFLYNKISIWNALRKKNLIFFLARIGKAIVKDNKGSAKMWHGKNSLKLEFQGISLYAEKGNPDKLMLPRALTFPDSQVQFVDYLRNMPLPLGFEMNICRDEFGSICVQLTEYISCTYDNAIFDELAGYIDNLLKLLEQIQKAHAAYGNIESQTGGKVKENYVPQLDAPIVLQEDIEKVNAKRKRNKRLKITLIILSIIALFAVPTIIAVIDDNRTITYHVDLGNGESATIYGGKRTTSKWRVGESETQYDNIYIDGILLSYDGEVSDFGYDKENGRIIWATRAGHSGRLDASGNEISPFNIQGEVESQFGKYLRVKRSVEGKIHTYGDIKYTETISYYGIYTLDGKRLIPLRYFSIYYDADSDTFSASNGINDYIYNNQGEITDTISKNNW